MKPSFLLPAAMAVLFLGTSAKAKDHKTIPTAQAKVSNAETALVKGNNAFAFNLYATLRRKQKGNLFFSPYSISTALGMTYAGARGKTAAEMAKTLHFTLEPKRLHPAFKSLISDLNEGGGQSYRLHVANALWAQWDYPFRPDFIKLVLDNYQGEANLVDFQLPNPARRTINAWVEKKTEDKIKELFKPGTLDRRTRLVLTNAIYFKVPWRYKFPKQATKDGKFRQPAAKPLTKVPLMHLTSNCLYYEGDNFQLLELPYKGDELAMVVLLPKKVNGLAAFEKELTGANLDGWLQGMKVYRVVITLPRLKITAEFDLKKVLSGMGMPLAFSNNADLSGMTQSNDLKITKVVHKAFVDVNEEGTEAAAATGVSSGKKKAAPASKPRAIFRADHPFVLLIRHQPSGSILFLGRVDRPK